MSTEHEAAATPPAPPQVQPSTEREAHDKWFATYAGTCDTLAGWLAHAALAQAPAAPQALPPINPHDHPAPQTMVWSALEIEWINQHISRALASALKEPQPAAPLSAQPAAIPDAMLQALRFYARGEHYMLDDDESFDTVSGEPQNWLCSGRENSQTMVENGSIALRALRGEPLTWIEGDEDSTPQPIEGEVATTPPPPADARRSDGAITSESGEPKYKANRAAEDRLSKPGSPEKSTFSDGPVTAPADARGSEVLREAERYRWLRDRYSVLCRMECARSLGLDLSRTYVNTAEKFDAVVDAALAASQAAPAQQERPSEPFLHVVNGNEIWLSRLDANGTFEPLSGPVPLPRNLREAFEKWKMA